LSKNAGASCTVTGPLRGTFETFSARCPAHIGYRLAVSDVAEVDAGGSGTGATDAVAVGNLEVGSGFAGTESTC
jgi:hypothetical protein